MTDPESTLPQTLRHATTDQLLDELERRERAQPGQWTGWHGARLRMLAEKLNPAPIRGT